MKILSMLGADEMAEAAFKRDNGDWIYKAPAFYGRFGFSAYYRVSDAQKATIKTMFAKNYQRGFIFAMLTLPVLFIALKVLDRPLGWIELAVMMVVAALIGVANIGTFYRQLRTVVREDQATSDTIGYRDGMQTYVAAMPWWRAVIYLAISATLFAITTWTPIDSLQPSLLLATRIMFGAMAAYFAVLLIAKLVRGKTA